MLIQKLREQSDFTPTEKTVADYMMENMESFGNPTVAELAAASYTSKAAILRLCKKLEFESYGEFKNAFQQEVQSLIHFNLLLSKEPFHEKTTQKEIIEKLPVLYEKALTDMRSMIDQRVMNRIVQRIASARRVDIYGNGITHAIASMAAFKLETLGIDCNVHNGLNEHYVVFNANQERRIAILFSFTGGNQAVVKTAEYLKRNKIYTVGIGGDYYPTLKQQCSEYISLPKNDDMLGMEVMSPVIVYSYVIDILFTALLVRNYRKHVETAAKVQNIAISELDRWSQNKAE